MGREIDKPQELLTAIESVLSLKSFAVAGASRNLEKYGYHLCNMTPAVWKHESRAVTLTLVVDDFGVKYVRKQQVQHLTDTLKTLHKITVDSSGKNLFRVNIRIGLRHRTHNKIQARV